MSSARTSCKRDVSFRQSMFMCLMEWAYCIVSMWMPDLALVHRVALWNLHVILHDESVVTT